MVQDGCQWQQVLSGNYRTQMLTLRWKLKRLLMRIRYVFRLPVQNECVWKVRACKHFFLVAHSALAKVPVQWMMVQPMKTHLSELVLVQLLQQLEKIHSLDFKPGYSIIRCKILSWDIKQVRQHPVVPTIHF